jgi:hypothetical protein
MPVLAAIAPRLSPLALSRRAYPDAVGGVGDGAATCRPAAWATARAWLRVCGEGPFHLGGQARNRTALAAPPFCLRLLSVTRLRHAALHSGWLAAEATYFVGL